MESNYSVSDLRANKAWHSVATAAVLMFCSSLQASWTPAEGPLMTRWAKDVSPDNVHQEYPRPQMVRKDWLNLNGLWEYAIRPKGKDKPAKFDGQILVPFPVESALSGVSKPVSEGKYLWYKRNFEVPSEWKGRRVLLHFEAVDWQTTVQVNGKKLGGHQGGYDPFTFDITDALQTENAQEIILCVWDPTNAGQQPRGKQVKKPGGIWYSAVTGIWRTVWLEPVPQAHIESLRIVPDVDNNEVRITVNAKDADGYETIATATSDGIKSSASGTINQTLSIKILDPKLWTPDSPYLYDLDVILKDKNNRIIDTVNSYFGLRKIEVKKDQSGVNRLFLNNKSLFQYGSLDQGWWPDGLYTAPTDEALRYDIEVLKRLGCNMMRKHVKVEPRCFYYWCDKLGLLVWQDMPNGNNEGPDARTQFELELKRMIETLRNHPSIVMWVPFNEGWGQYDTPRIVDWIKKHDPTRLVNNASGWADRGVGDVRDIHSYPGPAAPSVEPDRAAVLGEFGGLGLPISGHTWQDEKNWGYRSYKNSEELTDAYLALIENLRLLINGGLSAAVYTQTTDVEIEVNGLMTYDRAIIKMNSDKVVAANLSLFLLPPLIKTIVPTSQKHGVEWSYTTSKPDTNWYQPNFDDSSWQSGVGGFVRHHAPGAVVRTGWTSSDIWLRSIFKLTHKNYTNPRLHIHHDEDAEVYING